MSAMKSAVVSVTTQADQREFYCTVTIARPVGAAVWFTEASVRDVPEDIRTALREWLDSAEEGK